MKEEEINEDFAKLSALLSAEYIKLFNYGRDEQEKKDKGEEYDEELMEKLKESLMHLSHSMGELVEAKSFLVEKLSLPDMLCKMQYEQEMNAALETLTKTHSYDDILNDDNGE